MLGHHGFMIDYMENYAVNNIKTDVIKSVIYSVNSLQQFKSTFAGLSFYHQ